jgi:hypothetical protein
MIHFNGIKNMLLEIKFVTNLMGRRVSSGKESIIREGEYHQGKRVSSGKSL